MKKITGQGHHKAEKYNYSIKGPKKTEATMKAFDTLEFSKGGNKIFKLSSCLLGNN